MGEDFEDTAEVLHPLSTFSIITRVGNKVIDFRGNMNMMMSRTNQDQVADHGSRSRSPLGDPATPLAITLEDGIAASQACCSLEPAEGERCLGDPVKLEPLSVAGDYTGTR
mgnify:CR=1 FL=1